MENSKVFIAIITGSILLLAGLVFWAVKSTPPTSEPIKVEKAEVARDHSPFTGPKDAKVTLVEFGDFQCPACAAAHPGLKQLKTEYADKLKFVFRHFPLPMHNNAEIAARAAEAARKQDKFWEMHDMLFERQDQWSATLNAQGKLTEYAKELGLDTAQFTKDLKDQTVVDNIRLDKGDTEALALDSTPTLFINGEKITGASSYEALKARVEAELSK